MQKILSDKQTIVLVIIVAVALNTVSYCVAFPETFKPESANYARDFSAYYTGGWRLLHNPTKIYAAAPQAGDYQILPKPQIFKYTPSFLIILAPFLTLSYQNALIAFDLVQLALIPALAFFVYKLVKNKNLILGAAAAIVILIEPLPTPAINLPPPQWAHFWIFTLNPQSFAPSYYCGYLFANAHILQTILLVGALYLGYAKRPYLSALLFTFGLLDPRAALVTLPLLLFYNRQKILQFLTAATAFILATNLPFFFYNNIGLTFLRTEVNGNIISQMYAYDWIPIYSVTALAIMEIGTYAYGKTKHRFKSYLFKQSKNNIKGVKEQNLAPHI